MWWLDPGKDVLNVVFNRILAPYVVNLDMNQVNYGIGQGQLTLRNLRLKRGALDKFRLPVDVLEGHLGKFTLSLHWMNLGNLPVEVLIEDVYLLVVPSPQTGVDPEEEEQRAQEAKAERLENSELLHMRGQADATAEDLQQSQGLWASLTAKIINNLQVTVKNIHIRYEDKLSVPGHPFAAGITLAGFTAVSVNDQWQAAFIESTAGAIHKLANLQSLAVYFDTDSPSMAGLSREDAIQKFFALISHEGQKTDHQFILKPVSVEGRITMNNKVDKGTPKFDIQLFFNEISVALDDNQYRDAISLFDMYHVYLRQHQYRKFRPVESELEANRPRALLLFAGKAIVEGIRDRRRRWTWAYFKERRDDRQTYVDLFQKKLLGPLTGADLVSFERLEKKLSYEDLRFYRSIARSRLRKDAALRKNLEAEKPKQQSQSQGWTSWLWGSSSKTNKDDPAFGGPMTEEQRKQLYDALDYDEKTFLAESLVTARDALKARAVATLQKGSFTLRADPHGKAGDVISVVFDIFQATFIQRPDSFDASVSLANFSVFDGTTTNTVHPQIVQVQATHHISTRQTGQADKPDPDDPFFFVKFESNPLDERADSALTVRMRQVEIIYHKGYVEAVAKFLKPPASQLESVEALLSAAGQTLEGFRKETRAGLEFALQNHKTIDVQMDLNSPIIIIPEDITTTKCKHLVVDAGHISIDSDLANKGALREIHSKRNQQYSEEDYKRLESLMYDKMSLRLKAAQFVVGNDLQSCRNALVSDSRDSLHLLERINLDLLVQNSIVPKAFNLARFKVSGKLPALQVNLSDAKYKSLIRLIDVCIPKFDDGAAEPSLVQPIPARRVPAGFNLPPLFPQAEVEYDVDDDDDDDAAGAAVDRPRADEFFEVEDGSTNRPELRQHHFELDFQVDSLRASLSKFNSDGKEKLLGDVTLEQFALTFASAQFDMRVDINLRSLSLDLVRTGKEPIKFVSSAESDTPGHRGLLTVTYKRVQKESPQFYTVYEGIDQSVDIRISTFIFRAAPEPVLTLYDFIMTTFVPESSDPPPNTAPSQSQVDRNQEQGQPSQASQTSDKIRVLVKLATVQIILVNDTTNLATLSLSTADVALLLRANTMRISGRLGSLALSNDSTLACALPEFKQLMSIEGNNLAEFRYQTFNPSEEPYPGINSAVFLNAGSVKFHFLEEPLHEIYMFMTKLAKLKGLYDAATQVAVQKASEIERMQFEVSVKSPIVVFPSYPSRSQDVLVMRLGEISAKNNYKGLVNEIQASLRGIQLVSKIYYTGKPSVLKIIDDIDVTADVVQIGGIDRTQNVTLPDSQISVRISDVKVHLTQVQYGLLMAISSSVPRVLQGAPEVAAAAELIPSTRSTSSPSQSPSKAVRVDLEPELHVVASSDGIRNWPTVDLVVAVNAVKLHLYDGAAATEANVKEHGIARFILNSTTLRFKQLSDGAAEAQLVLKSITMTNTRPAASRIFREIIPAADHDRNQFMLLFTMSGGQNGLSVAILTVDTPQIILAIDPVISLLVFFTSASPVEEVNNDEVEGLMVRDSSPRGDSRSSLDFRVDLHGVAVTILENDTDANSQAIKLSINEILLSQQGIMALTVNRLGMSLVRVGKPSESVRFLDDLDLTVSLDSRTTSSQQMTSIEVSAKPIVFRASYRDINLITTIVNKAIARYGDSQQNPPKTTSETEASTSLAIGSYPDKPATSKGSRVTQSPARVMMSKEQLKASFEGFRLVLIGDMYEQPMLHLKVKPFIGGAKDWSGELQATTTMAASLSYWNLTNSHWEPLIDPWTFTISLAKEGPANCINVTLSARERLDLNISTTFAERAITMANQYGKDGQRVLQKARGSYDPYRIRNRTGSSIVVWPEVEGGRGASDPSSRKIAHDETIDWRFDDWKAMREHVSSGQHSIGLQFVGKPWDSLGNIPVDREGEYTFALRTPLAKHGDRVLCEVKLQENVKVVTIRSTYKIENQTLYPLELTLVNDDGQPVYSLEKIAPAQVYSLPIEAVTQNRIRLQPDQGFGYKWCPAIRWEELVAKKGFTIRCPHTDPRETAFRFQAWVETDANFSGSRKYPKINLKLRAPIELENLLPYNLQYRIYDKDTDQNWRSYLRTGGVMPVHSVELGHLVLLNVDIQDTVFQTSDFAIINTDGHSDFDIEKRLTLRDPNGRKLDLKLNYIRYPDSGGAFRVQLYTPYLVVNKTGLPFGIKSTRSARTGPPQEVAGEIRPEVLSTTTPFLLSHPSNGHEYVFRLGESSWSKLISLEAPAAETALVIPSQSQKTEEVHVGLSWTEGLGKYKLTKVVTLAPRFLLKNNMSQAIAFREHGVAPRDRSVIEPNTRFSLHVMRAAQAKLLTIAYPGLDTQWSPPFNVEDIGTVYFRLRTPNPNSTVHLICADVKINGSTIFVSFARADDSWPFVIENNSDYAVALCQTNQDSRSDSVAASPVVHNLAPHSNLQYAWDYPACRGKKIQLTIGSSRRSVDILEIGDLLPFKFRDDAGVPRAVSLDVRADGQKQALRITNYEPQHSLYKPRRLTASHDRKNSTMSSTDAFEAVTEEITETLVFRVEFAGIGISLVNRKMVEVIYVTIGNLKFEYTDSNIAQAVTLSCSSLQIDNQLHDALYPVILQPTPIPKESSGVAALPTVQASVIWLKDQAHGVFFVKYCSILLQALTIEADEDLLFAVYDLTQIKGASWEEGSDDLLLHQMDDIPEPQNTAAGQDLYFELLELQPIQLSLSFMRTERVSSEKLSIRNPLAVVVNALTMTVGNINDAPLELNALGIKDVRLTIPELQSRITYHYRQDVLRQLYRILGSADFIGNPVGLFTNVSSGVADVFYEPFHGVVMHGSKELGIGIAKGAASFVKKTVFGFSDSVTKFTSSMGKGLSAATFDSEYQTRRRMTQRRNRPRHAIYGVTAGGEAFASSVASAVEGIVMKPIEGAESEGAIGFFKGVGKGLVGVVTKPVVGVFDLASNVSEGIRNTTTVFDHPERDRVRLPRHIPPDGILRPYSEREALGQYWMKDLDNGAYRNEFYVAHINSPGGDNAVLLTASRVLSIWTKKLRLDWELPFTQVKGVAVEDTGVRFSHKSGTQYDKFVLIPDKSSQSWFFSQVATVVKAFNARRHIDP